MADEAAQLIALWRARSRRHHARVPAAQPTTMIARDKMAWLWLRRRAGPSAREVEALQEAVLLRLEALARRVEALGAGHEQPQAEHDLRDERRALADLNGVDTDTTRRLRAECVRLGLAHTRFRRTPLDYYEWTLEARRAFLGAASTLQLCKTVLMVNSKMPGEAVDDPGNAKYYAVVVQYQRRLHNEKLIKLVRGLKNNAVSAKLFNFRLCPEERSGALSGFGHNAVTPVGMRVKLPLILSHRVLELDATRFDGGVFWLGGGEVDVKWQVPVRDFARVFQPIVGDVTYDEPERDPAAVIE
jgi:prolyl-tRNA editing enzyme YbaK/EbsC (Cys-tRNA(Pro) deacylase)